LENLAATLTLPFHPIQHQTSTSCTQSHSPSQTLDPSTTFALLLLPIAMNGMGFDPKTLDLHPCVLAMSSTSPLFPGAVWCLSPEPQCSSSSCPSSPTNDRTLGGHPLGLRPEPTRPGQPTPFDLERTTPDPGHQYTGVHACHEHLLLTMAAAHHTMPDPSSTGLASG
jgi:hypothetical protein